MDAKTLRPVKIKTGVLKRAHKDYLSYNKEAKSLEDKVEALKASGANEHDIKQAQGCYEETFAILPSLKTKIE